MLKLSFADSFIPIMICLVTELGLAREVIIEGGGMAVQVINMGVLVLIPMVAIHVKGHNFSLGRCKSVCLG